MCWFLCPPPPAERPSPPQNLVHQDQNKSSVQLSWETPLTNGGSMITGYIIQRCEEGTDKWLRCNARLCPDLFYKVRVQIQQEDERLAASKLHPGHASLWVILQCFQNKSPLVSLAVKKNL